MRWIIRVTHEDDQSRAITAQYVIMEDLLDVVPEDYRFYVFKKMVKQIEDKLKANNPLAAGAEAFHGLPQASVSASNVDGNDVTDGETSPVQVSPWEFMSRVEGREDTVGEPVFWAQWPSKEKK